MKISEKFANTKKTLFSFEILPPLKGQTIEEIYSAIQPLMEFKPSHVNVTYHQEEIVYKKNKSGLLEKKIIWKRPGTVAISAAIQYKYGIPVVPHLICGGFTKEETENALIDLHFLGMNNLLVLRGDPQRSQREFIAEEGGHAHTSDLIKQIMDMNKGKYLDDELLNSAATQFSVGVAGYPEKHVEAPNLDSDLKYLKLKIDEGAEYIVTQMFFDNQHYFEFVERCREIGINVPIIPGLKPLANFRDLKLIPQIFNIDVPQDLVVEIEKCKNNDEVKQVGIEWTTMQSKQLIKFGVPALHYFTIGKSDNIRKIAANVF